MSARNMILIGLGIAGLIVLNSGLYVVAEWEQVVITQFGKPIGDPVTDAGLHWKTPFVQEANRIDKRNNSQQLL